MEDATARAGIAARPAPSIAELAGEVLFQPLRIAPSQPGWTNFNPSITSRANGELFVVVRSSNYRLGPARSYELVGSRMVHTSNRLLRLDDDLTVTSVIELEDSAEAPAFPVTGREDIRLVEKDGELLGLAASRDRDPSGICRQLLLRIQLDGHVDETLVVGPEPGRHEKNWAPFPGGSEDELNVVYRWDAVSWGTINLRSGVFQFAGADHSEPDPARSALRGGTNGVPTAAGMLFIVHERLPVESLESSYVHRFAALEPETGSVRLSPRFTLLSGSTEFAAGLALHGGDLLISFGVEDEEAWVARVLLDNVLGVFA